MRSRSIILPAGALFMLFALAGSLVSAEAPGSGVSPAKITPHGVADDQPYQYMVKYQCGWFGHNTATMFWVVPGWYETVVNVYNYTTAPVRIRKRPAISVHERFIVTPPVGELFTYRIHARRSLYIDCDDIYWMADVVPPAPLIGTLHISSEQKLPVSAMYTGVALDRDSSDYPDSGPSVHVEQYEPFVEP